MDSIGGFSNASRFELYPFLGGFNESGAKERIEIKIDSESPQLWRLSACVVLQG
jgi:hypothetical protein